MPLRELMTSLNMVQIDHNLWESYDGSVLIAQLPEGDVHLSRLDSLLSIRFSHFDRSIGSLLQDWMSLV